MTMAATVSGRGPFLWGRDNAAVADAVRRTRSTLKILLKTRNEDFFLGKWLEHYFGMLSPEDTIIVLDNMSTSERVFSLYERHADRIILVQYEGHVDSPHSLKRFAELYRAVWESSLFYALFDTDEFLALYDGRKIIKDRRVLRYLQSQADTPLFPPLFLTNIFTRDDAFLLEEAALCDQHITGKPILNSALMRQKLTRPVGHTRNVPVFLLKRRAPLSFILCHMTRLSREQRIMAAMQKLRSIGLITDENDMSFLERVSEADIDVPMVRGYVAELRQLLAIRDEREVMLEDMRRDHFTVGPDGSPAFSSEKASRLFAAHVTDKKNLLDVLDVDVKKIGDLTLPLQEALDGLSRAG